MRPSACQGSCRGLAVRWAPTAGAVTPASMVKASRAIVSWPRGVTVSTLDSESSDRGSNPREASFFRILPISRHRRLALQGLLQPRRAQEIRLPCFWRSWGRCGPSARRASCRRHCGEILGEQLLGRLGRIGASTFLKILGLQGGSPRFAEISGEPLILQAIGFAGIFFSLFSSFGLGRFWADFFLNFWGPRGVQGSCEIFKRTIDFAGDWLCP